MPQFLLALLLLTCSAFGTLYGQSGEPLYSRKNSISLFGEYSGNSSHILLGDARNRKLAAGGIAYTHRILLTHSLDLQYLAEFRPIVFVGDPVTTLTETLTTSAGTQTINQTVIAAQACTPDKQTVTGTFPPGSGVQGPYTLDILFTCGQRRWTYGQSLAPAGLRLSLFPHRRLQPVFSLAGGYLVTTRAIPVTDAGSFNFTLEFGGGVEYHLDRQRSPSFFGNRSLRAEYRFHHISNAGSANYNPGIDNGLFQFAYSFGR